MRRLSARFLIAGPWLASAVILIIAARTSWPLTIAAAFLCLILASVTSTYFSRALRTLRKELRVGRVRAPGAIVVTELDALRAAVNHATSETRQRSDSATLAEQRLLAVIESITEGILQVSANGRLVHVNPAAREMLSLPAAIEGQPAAALIRNPELRLAIDRAVAGASFEPVELTIDERHLLVSPRPLRSEHISDEVSGAVIAIVDLTEFRRLESVRRDFVANVSHELKTPLTSIRGYAETLLGDDVPREVQQQFLDVIYKNAERIQRIVDDLLDLSRLQSGGWQPELQEVDPALIAEDVWAGMQADRRKNISFHVLSSTQCDVLADPGGLRQVLANLFENAARYTPAGGEISVQIKPRAANGNGESAPDRYIDLVVSDTGSGIPRESLPRIFERFYRVDPARSRQDGGTGLGLSIVKHLVERMSGEVAAESELGKGTTIRVTLPAAST